MKRTIWIVALVIAVASIAGAQTTVVGTPHDLSATGPGVHTNTNQVCVFCHTPHQASTAVGQAPLWNHELSGESGYTVYDSSSMDASATSIGGATAGSAAASHLCMSCHDGTVAVHSMWNPPNEVTSVDVTTAGGNVGLDGRITGDPMIGTALDDDHPINFTYNDSLASTDGELVSPVSTSWVDAGHTVPLFNGSVQCASCHDAHKNPVGQQPFLVRNNDKSALCTTCHVK